MNLPSIRKRLLLATHGPIHLAQNRARDRQAPI